MKEINERIKESHKEDKQEFFSCSCYTEGILVSESKDPEDSDINIAMFSHGTIFPKRLLLSRIKYAWKHLITGRLWKDEVILTYTTAERLGRYLIERAKIKEKELIKKLKENESRE